MLTEETLESYISELKELDIVEAFTRLYELLDPETKSLERIDPTKYILPRAQAFRICDAMKEAFGPGALLVWLDKGPSSK